MSFSLRRRRSADVPPQPERSDALVAIMEPAGSGATAKNHAEAIRETIDLLEADLAAMIRDVQCTAGAVRQGVEASAQSLAAIRERSDALAGKSRTAKDDAVQLAAATEEFAVSSHEILRQVREAGELTDGAAKPPRPRPPASTGLSRLRLKSAMSRI